MSQEIEKKTSEFVGEIKRLVFEETKQRIAMSVNALPMDQFSAPDLKLAIPEAAVRRIKKAGDKPGIVVGLDLGSPRKKKAKRIVRANMIQWQCPVPKCKGKAAPVFGMVCGEHKDLPKAQIKKYRADRKAAALKAKGSK